MTSSLIPHPIHFWKWDFFNLTEFTVIIDKILSHNDRERPPTKILLILQIHLSLFNNYGLCEDKLFERIRILISVPG